jgi:SpoVK/Ycf46/Vps4 family AAA+-type ATPase
MGSISAWFSLSETGRKAAQECLTTNQYNGHAPVPLEIYEAAVRAQRLQRGWITPDSLANAYKHMVVSPDIVAQIGPAVNSAKSFLIYGQPGNGKTYLAEALFRIQSAPVYVPYAIECQGRIIQVYDPVYHQPIDAPEEESVISAFSAEPTYDKRWVKCKRPFIVTGGELAIEMLDLSFNSTSKVYDAPLQMKANNGIYLIDDFGRQRVTPAEVLNRWIIPLERRVDYLNLQNGGKITVPFEVFLVFSTNMQPDQLGDEAFLRRIQYKMFMRNPTVDEYVDIFERVCRDQNLHCPRERINAFIRERYYRTRRPMRRCHPRDLISHAVDLITFEELEADLTTDVLARAWESTFVSDSMEDVVEYEEELCA